MIVGIRMHILKISVLFKYKYFEESNKEGYDHSILGVFPTSAVGSCHPKVVATFELVRPKE